MRHPSKKQSFKIQSKLEVTASAGGGGDGNISVTLKGAQVFVYIGGKHSYCTVEEWDTILALYADASVERERLKQLGATE
jgi:hypothetical protein